MPAPVARVHVSTAFPRLQLGNSDCCISGFRGAVLCGGGSASPAWGHFLTVLSLELEYAGVGASASSSLSLSLSLFLWAFPGTSVPGGLFVCGRNPGQGPRCGALGSGSGPAVLGRAGLGTVLLLPLPAAEQPPSPAS